MKRIVSLVIVLLMIGVNALAQTNIEILFRDMPWGASYEDVKSQFPEFKDGYLTKGEEAGSPYSVHQVISTEKSHVFEEGISARANYYEIKEKVAGFPIKEVEFFFANAVVNGNVLDADTKCYAARYLLRPSDLDAAEAELKEKISILYGVPDESNVYSSEIATVSYTIWYGANGTGVALSKREIHFILPSDVCINYFTLEGDDWLQEASDVRKALLEAEREGDISGL